MKKRIWSLALALALCLGLAAPAFAAGGPEIEITWLSAEGTPLYYNREFHYLTLHDNHDEFRVLNLETGKIVAEYNAMGPFSEGLAWAAKRDEDGRLKYGFIDKTGKIVIPLEYDRAWPFSEGLAAVMKYDADGNFKVGFIDKTGKIVAPLEYDRDWDSQEGLAAVQKNGKCGFIDKTGKIVIPLEYDWVTSFSEGLAGVQKNGKWGFIDKTGKIVVPREYKRGDSFSEGLVCVSSAGWPEKWGFIDKTGKIVIPLEYDKAASFSEGLARVSKVDADGPEKWGFIDKTGKTVIPLEYDLAGLFSEGLAPVGKKDADGNIKHGFIDKTGKIVIPLEYDNAGSFSEGLAAVQKNGECGFIDKTGKTVVPLEYDDAGIDARGDELCYVRKDGRFGVFESPYYKAGEGSGGGAAEPTAPAGSSFTDVKEGDYFAQPVAWAVEKKITNGTSDTAFSPGQTCTVAQILTFLWRAKGSPEPAGTASLPGVDPGAYYYKPAAWAVERGLTDNFSPDAPCTRSMVVTYLWKLAGSSRVGTSKFSDVPSGASYAQAVAWAVERGITSGTSDTTFSPNDTCTRGQIVTFLYRAFAK